MTSVLDGPRREIRRIFHEGGAKWVSVSDDGAELLLYDGRRVAESDATYMAPCDPTKILCIHLNYDSRRVEFRAKPLTTPTYFQKPLTALNSHRGALHRPADCQFVNYEGEIAAVIGAPMRNVGPDDVWEYVAGFMPSNDVGLPISATPMAVRCCESRVRMAIARSGPAWSAASTSGAKRYARTSMGWSCRRTRSAT